MSQTQQKVIKIQAPPLQPVKERIFLPTTRKYVVRNRQDPAALGNSGKVRDNADYRLLRDIMAVYREDITKGLSMAEIKLGRSRNAVVDMFKELRRMDCYLNGGSGANLRNWSWKV